MCAPIHRERSTILRHAKGRLVPAVLFCVQVPCPLLQAVWPVLSRASGSSLAAVPAAPPAGAAKETPPQPWRTFRRDSSARLRAFLASACCSLYCCGGAAAPLEPAPPPELMAAPPWPNPPLPLSMISGFSGFML